MSSLMPRKLEVSLVVPCGPEIDTITNPTGLPSVSEVGPALPTMAMPKVVFSFWRTAWDMASAT